MFYVWKVTVGAILLAAHIGKYMYKYISIEAISILILLFLFVIIIVIHSFEMRGE